MKHVNLQIFLAGMILATPIQSLANPKDKDIGTPAHNAMTQLRKAARAIVEEHKATKGPIHLDQSDWRLNKRMLDLRTQKSNLTKDQAKAYDKIVRKLQNDKIRLGQTPSASAALEYSTKFIELADLQHLKALAGPPPLELQLSTIFAPLNSTSTGSESVGSTDSTVSRYNFPVGRDFHSPASQPTQTGEKNLNESLLPTIVENTRTVAPRPQKLIRKDTPAPKRGIFALLKSGMVASAKDKQVPHSGSSIQFPQIKEVGSSSAAK